MAETGATAALPAVFTLRAQSPLPLRAVMDPSLTTQSGVRETNSVGNPDATAAMIVTSLR